MKVVFFKNVAKKSIINTSCSWTFIFYDISSKHNFLHILCQECEI